MRALLHAALPQLGSLTLLVVLTAGASGRAHADPPNPIAARLGDAASHATTPDGAPDVLVQLPPDLDRTAPLRLVVFLHGHVSCVARYLASVATPCVPGSRPLSGLGVAAAHADSHDGTILVAPQ